MSSTRRRPENRFPAGDIAVVAACLALVAAIPSAMADSRAASPVIIAPDGPDAVVESSLDQWQDYVGEIERRKVEEARRLAPGTIRVPPRRTNSLPIDLWSRTELKGAAADPQAEGLSQEFGAALEVGRNLKLSFDTAIEQEGNRHETFNRAKLQSTMRFANWKLSPQATLVGRSVGTSTSGDADPVSTHLEVAPEVRRPFRLEDGATLEPFLNMQSTVGLDGSDTKIDMQSIDRVGVGVSFSQPGDYRLDATTELAAPESSSTPAGVNGRVKLTVPLD